MNAAASTAYKFEYTITKTEESLCERIPVRKPLSVTWR